jgi:hypothetical protein
LTLKKAANYLADELAPRDRHRNTAILRKLFRPNAII